MIHDSELFNFQEIINSLREKAANLEPEKKESSTYLSLLGSITENTELEDLSLYKEYLSKFDVEHDLEGFELSYDAILEEHTDVFPILLKFVVASFSCNYSFDYDVNTSKVVLTITVGSDDQTITRKLDELWSFQIYQLFVIYLKEQLELESLRENSEEERRAVDEERNRLLELYRDNIQKLKDQKEAVSSTRKI